MISGKHILDQLHAMRNECERTSAEYSSDAVRWTVNGYADVLTDAIKRIESHSKRAKRAYRTVEAVHSAVDGPPRF